MLLNFEKTVCLQLQKKAAGTVDGQRNAFGLVSLSFALLPGRNKWPGIAVCKQRVESSTKYAKECSRKKTMRKSKGGARVDE